ncbi:MAG TPA: 30S ribosomal protein S20 [Candidatus Dormibacteraeota bacterium]|nr:30S ribosomal protein S20 [Candidatus Dormibacteraeota bacterium]
MRTGPPSAGGRPLPNTPSAKKRARRSIRRALRNRSIKSAVKTRINKFRRGLAQDAEDAESLAVAAISALDRAVAKGVLHRNNAARRKARLMKRLNAARRPGNPESAAPRR